MALPVTKYEIAFDGSPLADPATFTWTDVTAYVMPGWTATRGIQRNLVDPRTGEAHLTLDNRTGRFDPGNAASPYAPNVTPYRPLRITGQLTATTYGVWYGYIEQWPVTWSNHRGRFGTGNVLAVDAIGFLNGVDAHTTLDSEVLADGPLWYYRLGEDADSASAGDIIDPSSNPPLEQRDSKYGPGTLTFGTDIGLRGGGTGVFFDSDQAGTSTTGPISVLRSRPGRGGPTMAPTSGGFTFEAWVRTPHARPGFVYVPWGQFSDDSNIVTAFYIGSDGRPYAFIGQSTSLFASSLQGPNICDGGLHHLWSTVSADYKTVSLVIDGVDYFALTNAAPVDLSGLTTMLVGGQLLQNGNSFNGMKGSVAAVAMYPGVLSASRAAAHYRAGLQAFSGETTSSRISRILDYAGWPAALRDVQTSTGRSGPLLADTVGKQLLDTADAEYGRLYVAADGKITFRSRADLFTQATPTIVFGEDAAAGEIPYETDPVLDYDPMSVVNQASGSRPGGATVTVADPTRTYTRSASFTLNVSNDAQVVDTLNYILQQRSQPQQRLGQVTIKANTKTTAVFAQLLQLPPGTRIRFIRRAPTVNGVTPPTVTVDCYLETQDHEATMPEDWTMRFTFSPLPRLSYWRLEDATYGVLGSTTRLGF